MAELLVRFERMAAPSWPARDRSRLSSGLEFFTLHDRDGVTLAQASCNSPIDCELTARNLHLYSSAEGALAITSQEIYASGPHG